MRPILPLPLLLLAACETPIEACVNALARQIGTVESLIAEVQGNLARGYAIEQEQVVREVPDLCRYADDEGETRTGFCERTEVRTVSRPVAIDPGAERAKLEGLLAQREALREGQAERLLACQALPDR